MEYRLTAEQLLQILNVWDELISTRGKIHLIACGGTALTLLGYKESTKDVDFLIPNEKEYKQLIKFLAATGYKQVTGNGWKRENEIFIFDLYLGSKVYCTELLESPLKKGKNKKIYEGEKIYLGSLNAIDLIISKMFRGTEVDVQDSILLIKNEKVDLEGLKDRYKETAKYDISETKVLSNLEILLKRLGGRK